MTDETKASPEEHVDIELADEMEILAELEGKTFEQAKYVYKTKDGGFQLSYRGINQACRAFAGRGEAIEVLEFAKVMYDPQEPEYILAQVRGQRVKVDPKTGTRIILDSAIGSKRKWKKQTRKEGAPTADPFFFEKAISQAQCNAKRALLPQDFILDFVKSILKGPPKGQKKGSGGAGTQKPPAEASGQPPASQGASGGTPQGGDQGAIATLRQQFWAVLKGATGIKEDAKAREVVGKLTGEKSVSKLPEVTLKKLGGILRKVSTKECEITKDTAGALIIKHGPSGDIVWPEGYKAPQAAPPPTETAAAPAGAAPGGGEWMF